MDAAATKPHAGGGPSLVGEGSFACVFHPPPRCFTQEHPLSKRSGADKPLGIGKVFERNGDAIEEWAIIKAIAKLDPKQAYFIYPLSQCTVLESAVRTRPNARGCSLLGHSAPNPSREYIMLKMPTAKETSVAYVDSHRKRLTISELLRGMIPVARGLERLARAKIIHHDLKQDNVMWLSAQEGFRLIDFGLAIPMGSAFDPNKNWTLAANYFLHPPEYRMFHQWGRAPRSAALASMEYEEDRHLLAQIAVLPKRTLLDEITSRYLPADQQHAQWTAFHDALASKPTLADARAFAQRYATRIDTYAFGLLLVALAARLSQATAPEGFYRFVGRMISPDPRVRPSPAAVCKWIVASAAKAPGQAPPPPPSNPRRPRHAKQKRP